MKHVAMTALASALAVTLFTQPGFAQTAANAPAPAATKTAAAKPAAATDKAAPTKTDPSTEAIMKFSQDGNDAMREIAAARVAVFNANPKGAMDMLNKAKASLAKAEAEAPTFAIKTTVSVEGKKVGTTSDNETAKSVPVDGQLVLSDDFVPTPEKLAHINKANEHFKKGEKKEAMDELRLGEIDVMYNRAWLPLASTAKHLDQARKLMDEHKYYEANLALKAIGDSMTVDSVSLTEAPKQAAAKATAEPKKAEATKSEPAKSEPAKPEAQKKGS